jgi:ATPase subunit of ABC transporter with duplicated ATPase domains
MLTLSEISKAYGGRVLFNDVTLQLNREDRIGLVGPNGAGKSTLFSIILGEEEADSGQVMKERNVVFGYLPQESAPVGEETVLELATAISPEFAKLRRIILSGSSCPGIPTITSRRITSRKRTTTRTTAFTNSAVIRWTQRRNKFCPASAFAKKISTKRRAS